MTEQEIISLVNDLGAAEETLQADPGSPLDQLLKSLMQEVVDKLKQKLVDYDAIASANLTQSIRPSEQVYLDGDILTIHVEAPNYWKFVNYGVNGTERSWGSPAWGKQPPTDMSFHASIMNWMSHRGIKNDPARSPTMEAAAWAIMTNIRKNGQKPRPFYSDVVNQDLFDYLGEQISTLIGRAITVKIIEPWQ